MSKGEGGREAGREGYNGEDFQAHLVIRGGEVETQEARGRESASHTLSLSLLTHQEAGGRQSTSRPWPRRSSRSKSPHNKSDPVT